MTFTTKEEVETNEATMEEANWEAEDSQFQRYEDVRMVRSALFDHTNNDNPTSTDGLSIRLSGSEKEKTGLIKTLSVMPGDVVHMKEVVHTKGPVVQSEDYYPFGLMFNNSKMESVTVNNYLYNNKERQDELGLGWMDYGARMYMPDIGRWGVVDPLTELYHGWSPYSYALNSPSNLVDLEGLAVGDPKYTGSGSVVIIIADISTGIEEGFWHAQKLDKTAWDYGFLTVLLTPIIG